MPLADAYAAAIVAAARLTGENPESFVEQDPECKFRHYAMHALLHVFPNADRTKMAAAIGAPGKPSYFYRSSLWHVLGQGPHRQTPIEWWTDENMGIVIKAVLDVTRPEMVEAAKAVPRSASTETPLSPSCAKPITPKAVLRHPEAPIAPERPAGRLRTRLDAIAGGVSRAPRSPSNPNTDWLTEKAIDRGRSRDLLAEAAANTAKLQAKLPPEPDE